MAHSSSKANEPTLVTATFKDPDHAKRAYKSIIDRKGYSDDDVNVLMSDETRDRHFASEGHVEVEEGSKAGKGAGMGAATGGTLGGLAGALLAAGGAVTLPGIGLVIAGPLAAALAGAGGGGAAGTLVGALVGAGIPEKRAKKYESDIKEGGIVLGVRPQNAEDERHFRDEWKRHQGERIHAGDGTTSGTGPMEGYTSARDKRYRDRDFADVEDELRGRYKERHPDSSWDKVKRAVKHAFQRRRRRST